jgi:hypothetical protein
VAYGALDTTNTPSPLALARLPLGVHSTLTPHLLAHLGSRLLEVLLGAAICQVCTAGVHFLPALLTLLFSRLLVLLFAVLLVHLASVLTGHCSLLSLV